MLEQRFAVEERIISKQNHSTVLCFNIRRDTSKDQQQAWSHRKELCLHVIQDTNADIICLQEVLAHQLDYLSKNLASYTMHGIGRKDGNRHGEFVPIFYNAQRYSPIRAGHFWLSETPTIAGSKSWGARNPRMCSWIMLHDHAAAKAKRILILNTHFDHVSKQARQHSPAMLIQCIQKFEQCDGVIVCGDFNSPANGPIHQHLCQQANLLDAHHAFSSATNTAHQYTGSTTGTRIDWILHSTEFTVEQAHIRTDKTDIYPSDHFPIVATLRIN